MTPRLWRLPAWPPVNRREALRYAQWPRGEDCPALDALAERAAPLLQDQVLWAVYPLREEGDSLDLGFARTGSRDLRRSLAGCDRVLLMAATLGVGLDREIARRAALSPAEALLLHGLGAERVEALCDAFCAAQAQSLAAEGSLLRPRFSPGYGDLPLELQREIFSALDCPRRLGLTLNPSLLMAPAKSVTALAGIARVSPSPELPDPDGGADS